MIQTFIRFLCTIKKDLRFLFKYWICMLVRMVKLTLSTIRIANFFRSSLESQNKFLCTEKKYNDCMMQ